MPLSRPQKQVMRKKSMGSHCVDDNQPGGSGGSNRTATPAYKAPKQVGKKSPSASGFLK